MKFDCEIEVLSPVHIGSGAPLTPMDYIVSNGNFAKFALDRYLSSKPERFATAFLMKLEAQIREKKGRVSLMNLIKGEESNPAFWEWSIPIEPSAEDLIRRLVGDKEKGRLLDFQTFIRDSNSTPVIPGSSVKGALRTVFAHWILRQKDFQSLLQNLNVLNTDKKGNKWVSRDLDRIEEIIYRDIKSPDAKNDVLRFLQVSDFYSSSAQPTCAVYSQIMSAQPGKNQYSFTKNGNPRYSFFEAVVSQEILFKGSIKIELDMLNIVKKHFSWSKSAANCLTQIARAANDLAYKQMAFDSYFFNKYNSPLNREEDSKRIMRTYSNMSNLRKQIKDNECILRIGAGGGWHSKTIGLHFYNYDYQNRVFIQMDVLQELKGKGTNWKNKRIRGRNLIREEFPKTRRIVFANGEPAFPIGWVKLTLNEVK